LTIGASPISPSATVPIGTGASTSRALSVAAGGATELRPRRGAARQPSGQRLHDHRPAGGEIGFLTELKPDVVSVLVGVNDLVRGSSVEAYRESVGEIYDAIATLHLAPGRATAISIPDWSVVPAARDYGDPQQIHARTDAFNGAAREEASRRALTWVDITEVSRGGRGVDGWVSADHLHPGDAQYAAWADVIWDGICSAWTSAGTT
jgi:lysophospholipase L1-like esterase